MANLKSLKGISDAGNELFNKLDRGEVTEAKAKVATRIIDLQMKLHAYIPLALIKIADRAKGAARRHVEPLVRRLAEDMTGAPIALADKRRKSA